MPSPARCLYEAWQTSRQGKGRLVILSYGINFEPLKKVMKVLEKSLTFEHSGRELRGQ
jgi:hypothetical protein